MLEEGRAKTTNQEERQLLAFTRASPNVAGCGHALHRWGVMEMKELN
jgi:hypothetical protein